MEKLNNVQIRAFRQIFENFDLEKSGTLTAEELHKCINQLAGYQALSFQDVVHILEDLDVKERIYNVLLFFRRAWNLENFLAIFLASTSWNFRAISPKICMFKSHKGTGDIEFDEFIFFMTRPQVSTNQNSWPIRIANQLNSEFGKNVDR